MAASNFKVKLGITTPKVDYTNSSGNVITVDLLSLASPTLSFSGTTGPLFSITDDMTGTIFSVNDVSGVPSLSVDADGTVLLAEISGNVGIGTNSPTTTLDVNGTTRVRTIADVAGDFITTDSTGLLSKRTPAETLSDIGALPLTGGTVTGLFGTSTNLDPGDIFNLPTTAGIYFGWNRSAGGREGVIAVQPGGTGVIQTLSILSIDPTGATTDLVDISPGGNLEAIGKAYFKGGSGLGGAPLITLATGDNASGINWLTNGHIALYAQNVSTIDITQSNVIIEVPLSISGTATITGATTLNSTLSVAGSTYLSNSLSFTNTAITTFLVADISDTSYGQIQFHSPTAPLISWARYNPAGNAFEVMNNTAAKELFHVRDSGDTWVAGALSVTGISTFTNDLNITGNETVSGTLSVAGVIDTIVTTGPTKILGSGTTAWVGMYDATGAIRTGYIGDSVSSSSDLWVAAEQGNLVLSSATGAIVIPTSTSLSVESNASIGGSLSVTGTSVFTASSVFNGTITFTNPLTYSNTSTPIFLTVDVSDTSYEEISFSSPTASAISWRRDNSTSSSFEIYDKTSSLSLLQVTDFGDTVIYRNLDIGGELTSDGVNVIDNTNLFLKAAAINPTDPGDIVFTDDIGTELSRIYMTGGYTNLRYNGIGGGPIAISDNNLQTGLNADMVDSQHGTYYLAWSNLTGVPSSFNPSAHVLATTSGIGAEHRVSGLTTGQVLRATGATTAAFESLLVTDLPTITVPYGGTGLVAYTVGNYINAATTTTLQQRTPAQVVTDIGAVDISSAQTVTGAKTFTAATTFASLLTYTGTLDGFLSVAVDDTWFSAITFNSTTKPRILWSRDNTKGNALQVDNGTTSTVLFSVSDIGNVATTGTLSVGSSLAVTGTTTLTGSLTVSDISTTLASGYKLRGAGAFDFKMTGTSWSGFDLTNNTANRIIFGTNKAQVTANTRLLDIEVVDDGWRLVWGIYAGGNEYLSGTGTFGNGVQVTGTSNFNGTTTFTTLILPIK